MKNLLIFLLLFLFFFVRNAHAIVQVSDLDDFIFPAITEALSSNAILDDNICVYSDTGNYNVQALGDGPSNTQVVSNGSETIEYRVRWDPDNTGNPGFTRIRFDRTESFSTNETSDPTCGSGASLNSILRIQFRPQEVNGSVPGLYTGVLTIILGSE